MPQTHAAPRSPLRLPWGAPLVPARFVERPNRFLVRAVLDGDGPAGEGRSIADPVEAHLADPGRLRELLVPGARLALRPEPPSSTRRTRWTAVLVEAPGGGTWVSVHTSVPNRLLARALEEGVLPELAGWRLRQKEAPLGSSRIDFLLADGQGRRLYLETKSVTLVEGGVARFPDAVTARGARHVEELTRAVREGHEAAVLFLAQRDDVGRIVAARDIDPVFADALERAVEAGVRVLGRRCRVDLGGVELGVAVPAGVE